MVNKLKEVLFKNLNTRQTIAKNLFWLSVGQIGSRLFRALIIIYAARALGAAEYGVFSYALGLAGFFTIFADIGVNYILTRETAKNPKEAETFFATTFWIKIVLLAITAGLLLFLAPYFSKIEGTKVLLPFVAILTVFDGIREFSIAFFRAKEKMELEALLTTATNVAITVFGFAILYFFKSSQALIVTYALSAGTGTLIGIIVLRKEFAKVFSLFKRELVPSIMSAAIPIALLGIVGAFMLQVDILMLGAFSEAEKVGFYSAGQKIVQLLYVLPALIATTIFPSISKLVGSGENDRARTFIERSIAIIFSISLPITLGGIILGKGIINFLYGAEYAAAALPFQILAFTILFVFPAGVIGNYIFAYNMQKGAVPHAIIGSVSNVLFNLLLIPIYGAAGAAVATVASQIIYNGLIWRLAKKINNFETLPYIKKLALAATVMGVFSFALNRLNVHVIANIVLSAAVYGTVLFFLKEKVVLEAKQLIRP